MAYKIIEAKRFKFRYISYLIRTGTDFMNNSGNSYRILNPVSSFTAELGPIKSSKSPGSNLKLISW